MHGALGQGQGVLTWTNFRGAATCMAGCVHDSHTTYVQKAPAALPPSPAVATSACCMLAGRRCIMEGEPARTSQEGAHASSESLDQDYSLTDIMQMLNSRLEQAVLEERTQPLRVSGFDGS